MVVSFESLALGEPFLKPLCYQRGSEPSSAEHDLESDVCDEVNSRTNRLLKDRCSKRRATPECNRRL